MHAVLLLCTLAGPPARVAAPSPQELLRWEREARAVTIVRDDWGIAHVRGKTDADAVFGMIYAQAEDDFNRIETNFISSLGRMAEAEGEAAIWQDLRIRLFVDPDTARARFGRSPVWLKRLMVAWADGLNYYLHTHPDVTPRVISRFEPWMALTFTEGSIGADYETVSLDGVAEFYGDSAGRRAQRAPVPAPETSEPAGSNAFAIAPSNTSTGRALLLINPHTSLYFRAELQMTSEEGLDAYGAATWGQFFVYQGFNRRLGWMHASANADAIDEYAETIVRQGARLFYRYGNELRPLVSGRVTLRCRTPDGMVTRTFTVYRTHHGPIVRAADGSWISVRLMDRPIEALSQSWLRTKARTIAEYRKTLEFHANSSNSEVYADADGHIAYFHPGFVPRRDDRFDWSRPVDGSDPATEWRGVHGVADSPHVVDPPNGWIQNTNDWPWSAAGAYSPKRSDFPRYMDTDRSESPRGEHAIQLLESRTDFTLDGLQAAAFDSYLPAFAKLIPGLLAAYDSLHPGDPLRAPLAGPVAALRSWDFRWAAGSVSTTLAVLWGEALAALVRDDAIRAGETTYDYIVARATPVQRMTALDASVQRLASEFGTWRVPWGDVNRFQRLTGDIELRFDDSAPSTAIPFTSSRWGSLAAFAARTYPGTRRMYGTSGNTFVAVVEFGRDSVRARAVTAGGESGDSRSPHFRDQVERYAEGRLRDVYFYPAQLAGHTERAYHPE